MQYVSQDTNTAALLEINSIAQVTQVSTHDELPMISNRGIEEGEPVGMSLPLIDTSDGTILSL